MCGRGSTVRDTMQIAPVPAPATDPLAGLTAREREVARLITAGATNAEIAQALCVGLPTVKTHVSHLLHKLGARSRTELVARLGAPPVGAA